MTKPHGGITGAPRLLAALRHSVRGLIATFRSESAFRQELALALMLAPLGLWLGRSGVERALLVGVLLLVLVVELLNTAVEMVVDRVGPELHPLAARAKDAGSAAVFVALILAGVVWALIAWQRWGG